MPLVTATALQGQGCPFDSHGQKVFTDGKTILTRDVDMLEACGSGSTARGTAWAPTTPISTGFETDGHEDQGAAASVVEGMWNEHCPGFRPGIGVETVRRPE